MTKGNFKNQAKLRQLECFKGENQADVLNSGRPQPHWLNEDAAVRGKIFYEGYEIFGFVKEWREKTDTPEWFYDTLRSQHIPFNFFVPLISEKRLCINVLNHLFKLDIAHISAIRFEYPKHSDNPLKDKTSFDVFISYVNPDFVKGFIGFEVKYTEGGYSPTEKENQNPVYYYLTPSELYLNTKEPRLKDNAYRQIWRNHLLGYLVKKEFWDKFLSVTLYPEGNIHFTKAIAQYENFLTEDGKTTLKGLNYEDFFLALIKFCRTPEQKEWVKYLIKRYLVTNQEYYLKQLEEVRK
jgi:hypothetical protein